MKIISCKPFHTNSLPTLQNIKFVYIELFIIISDQKDPTK